MLELDQFRYVYFQECEELLESLEVQLTALQEGAEADDVIQEAFRAIHSIKGGAGALQFRRIGAFAHNFEVLFDKIRTGEAALDPGLLALSFSALDMLTDLIAAEQSGSQIEPGIEDHITEALQDASGELAAMAIGASLWGLANQTLENGDNIRTKRAIGCQYNYNPWQLESPIFPLARATGLKVTDWQDLILVNQVGRRFWDETQTGYDFSNAALGTNGGDASGGGPIWAIFDSDAVAREEWDPTPPYVDHDGWFFYADTLAELAARIINPYQKKPLPASALEATVARYNENVNRREDPDFVHTRC